MFNFQNFQKELLSIEQGAYRQAEVITIATSDATIPVNPAAGGDVPTGKEFKKAGTLFMLLSEFADGSGSTTISDATARLLVRFNYPDAPPLSFGLIANSGILAVYQGIFKSFYLSVNARTGGKVFALIGVGIGAASSTGGPGAALSVTPY